jgi:hypothetical protein
MSTAKQAYQLVSKFKLPNGAYVEVNGLWDSHGVVTSSAPHEGGHLNQIRGVNPRPGAGVAYKF